MAKITPQRAAEKQAERLKSSITDIQAGVEGVTVAPGVKAAKKQQKMLQNLTEAVTSGKWAANVSAVTLEDWKSSMIQKGIPRIASGIDAAKAKQEKFYEHLFAFQDGVKKEIEAMPDITLEDSINRMTKWVRRMADYQKPAG